MKPAMTNELSTMIFIFCAGAGECFALEVADVRMEFCASRFDCGERTDQMFGDVFSPSLCWRVNAEQGGKNGSPELCRSDAISVVSSNSERAEQGNKSSEDWQMFHLIFSCLLPFWIVWMCGGYSMKPNVEHDRRTAGLSPGVRVDGRVRGGR